MKGTRPELGLERVLRALEQDLLEARNDEVLAIATELGLKPDMKGSIALFGVTFTSRLRYPPKPLAHRPKKTRGPGSPARPRRRPKDDVPPST